MHEDSIAEGKPAAIAVNEVTNENQPSDISEQQETFHFIADSCLAGYILDDKDIKIIELLFNGFLDEKDGMKAVDILKKIDTNRLTALCGINRLKRLKQSGILEIAHPDEDEESAGAMLRSMFRLSKEILDKIFGETEEQDSASKKPYKDNAEYLSEHFERIRLLGELKGANPAKRRANFSKKNIASELNKLETRIAERLSVTGINIPLEEFKKKNNLNKKEELVIIALLYHDVINDNSIEIEDMINLISRTPYEILADRRLFERDGKLNSKKIIEITRLSFRGGKTYVEINRDLKQELLEEKKKRKRVKLSDNGFFEIIKPEILFDNVILPQETMEDVNLAIGMIQGNAHSLLAEWGLKESSLTVSNKKQCRPVTMLFYGPPGTGKTLAANAIANKLKRDLATLDCSKVVDKYVGESEKNTRKIFDRYREITKKIRKYPVLLLNEADQFLHKRINASRSTDHMYNQMQNIFLEQMEKFEGILIATTNLVGNLDSAFSRRFHHKIEFKRPGTKERFRLWQIHMPQNAPLSDDVDIKNLADRYDLSGGQIALIIRNAAAKAAMRGDRLCMEDLMSACENEMIGNFDDMAKQKIGF